MKTLFITHSGSLVYGAAKSLGYLLRSQKESFDLLCSDILLNTYGEERIREYAGPQLCHLYSAKLPNRMAVCSPLTDSYITNLYQWCVEKRDDFRFWKNYSKIRRIIKDGNYDVIHLNSIILYPLIKNNATYTMHVREVYTGREKIYFNKALKKVRALLAIDEATFKSIPTVYRSKTTVLTNPFDMSNVSNIDVIKKKREYCISATDVVFSILGVISKSKGVDIAIRAFLLSDNPNARLLIIGNGGDEAYVQMCKEIARRDNRIAFIGELSNQEDVDSIYAITDYVVRADSLFAIGRTVYEGLYAGCSVMMQGEKNDITKFCNGEEYMERVFFYKVLDVDDMSKCFAILSQKKPLRIKASKNTDEYANIFDEWRANNATHI